MREVPVMKSAEGCVAVDCCFYVEVSNNIVDWETLRMTTEPVVTRRAEFSGYATPDMVSEFVGTMRDIARIGTGGICTEARYGKQ